MRRAQGTAARAATHQALLRGAGSAYVAHLSSRIGFARRHRHPARDFAPRDGVVPLRAAGALDLCADFLVAGAPVLPLTERITVLCLAPTVMGFMGA